MGDAPASDAPSEKKKQKYRLTPEMKADPVSRKLILYSMIFATLALICFSLVAVLYYKKTHADKNTEVEAPHSEKIVVITQPLEQIHVVLKNEQDLRVEIAVECGQKETCDYIKNHPAEARDLLIPILTSIDPDLFASIENKKLIRKKLTDRLNTLEMPGKVIQVHFNNLSIEGNSK